MRIALSLSRPGANLDPKEQRFVACAANHALEGAMPVPLAIENMEHNGPGPVKATMQIPYEILPNWGHPWQTIEVVVASDDGRYVGRFHAAGLARGWAIVAAGVVLVLFAIVIMHIGRHHLKHRRSDQNSSHHHSRPSEWFMGALIGHNGELSISQFQILLWTVVTALSLIYVLARTSDLLVMTPEVMGLLGLAGAGSIGARLIASPRRADKAPAPCKPAQFWDIIQTNGVLDLFKLQLFVFTCLIALYVVMRVVIDAAFPKLDPNFLLLMGVTNGLYVGSKVATPNPPPASEGAGPARP